MTEQEMVVGARVRLICDVGGNTPGDLFYIKSGETGTVEQVFPDAPICDGSDDWIFAYVRLDNKIEDLDEWDNILAVWRDPEQAEVTPKVFELIV